MENLNTKTFTYTNETSVQLIGDFSGSTKNTSQTTNTGLEFCNPLILEFEK